MDKQKHSSLPWKVLVEDNRIYVVNDDEILIAVIAGGGRVFLSAKTIKANAALIVQAVNCHAKLVEVLRDELQAIRVWQAVPGYEWKVAADLRNGLEISATKIEVVLANAGEL